MAFNLFPYSNFHRLNADWILAKIKEAAASVAESLAAVRSSAAAAAASQTAAEAAQTAAESAAATAEANLTACVKVTEQEFSGAQQGQARDNIGAASAADMTTAQGNITTLQGEMDTAEGNITTLQGKMSTAEGNITTLQGKMSTAEGNIATLQGKMSTAEGDIDTLQADVSTAEGDITTLQGEMSTVQGVASTAATNALQAVRFVEGSGADPDSVIYPSLSTDQITDFQETFNLLKHASPEALYSLALFGQIVSPNYGWPRVRLERVEDGNGGAYFKISQRESENSQAGNVDCRLSGVASPTAGSDAVNKAYADGAYMAQVNPYIRLSAANQYPRVGLSVLTDNGSYYLAFSIQATENGPVQNVRIGGVANPTGTGDVATKDYVDANSGSAPFIITVTGTNPVTVDKSITEIKAAIDAGRNVILSDGFTYNVLTNYEVNNGVIVTLEFTYTHLKNNEVFTTGFTYTKPFGSSSGEWSEVYENAVIPSST